MDDSGGRWWEILGAGQPDSDGKGYRDVVTETRGRSRPERSLSAGVELADGPRHLARAGLWLIVSVVVAAALALAAVHVLPRGESGSASEHTTSPLTVAPGGTRGDAEGESLTSPTSLGTPPAADGAPPVMGVPGTGSREAASSDRTRPAQAPISPPSARSGGPAPANNPPSAGPAPINNPAPANNPAPRSPAPVSNPVTGNPAPAEAEKNRLLPNEQLGPGQRLVSPDGRFVLIMQKDGNLVEYAPGNRAVWASGTSTPQSIVRMQKDGNLVVIAPGNKPVWGTGTDGNPNATLELQDDGNVVVYAQGHKAIWDAGIP